MFLKHALYYLVKACENHLTKLPKTNNCMEVEAVKSLFDALFTVFCQELAIQRVLDERVNLVLRYIHEKCLEDITLSILANLVHLEQRQLLRIFKKSMNTSPIWNVLPSITVRSKVRLIERLLASS